MASPTGQLWPDAIVLGDPPPMGTLRTRVLVVQYTFVESTRSPYG
jgi:hypothetical protein